VIAKTYRFIEGFSGTNRYILDYLLEEVLASQSPEIQRFLLCTSILERLTAPLCDAVLADDEGFKNQSASILAYLERANLFLVPLDDERCWYRYHHLFADLLQARLNQSGAERVAQLRSRAAAWCEEEGQIAEAIDYALAAQDYQRAARLIASYWHVAVSNGEIETAGAWLDALPEDTVRRSAPLGVAYCWVLWLKGQVGAIEAHLVSAETALNEQILARELGPDGAAHADLPAQLALLHSIVARYNNDCEGRRCACRTRHLPAAQRSAAPGRCATARADFFCAGVRLRQHRRPRAGRQRVHGAHSPEP
jgi:LuxR family maltose regulon positive regulatory protein